MGAPGPGGSDEPPYWKYNPGGAEVSPGCGRMCGDTAGAEGQSSMADWFENEKGVEGVLGI